MKKLLNRVKDDHSSEPVFKLLCATPLPAMIDLRPLSPPIYDQGDFGSCTGNAWCRLLEFIEMMELRAGLNGLPEEFGNTDCPLSRLFLYFNERGKKSVDQGAQLADGAKAAGLFGVCKESSWPYNKDDLLTQPSAECYSEAALHRVTKTMKIFEGDLISMKTCLQSGYPFVLGLVLYESFMSDETAANGVMLVPEPGEGVAGGHAVCCVGYDDTKKVFIVANSWGDSWGDKGYFYLPYEYAECRELTSDLWTARK